MIKANELRIGNWVNRNDMGGHFTVRAVSQDRITPIHLIDHDSLRNVHYACECTLSELEPILLTPEILEKSGFIFGVYTYSDGGQNEAFVKGGGRWVITKLELGGSDDGYGLAWFPYPQSQNIIPGQLFYLHQLQNLFFALTGTELEVKL